MTKFLILAAIVVASLASVTIAPEKTHGQKVLIQHADKPIPNRYIVVLDENVVRKDAVGPEIEAQAIFLSSAYGGSVKKVFADAIKGFVVEMSATQAKEMSIDPSIKSIEEDGYIGISSTETNAPWALDRIDQRALPLDTTYSYTGSGIGVHAYILDTGINVTHAEFGGRASVAYDPLGDGQNGIDCNGHGSHVAGLIGSSTYGVAKNVTLHSVRVLPCDGVHGQISDLVDGISWVAANKIRPAVANISITSAGTSSALETVLTNAIASGVTFTIAAGNNNADACGYTPARTAAAITVGATGSTDVRAGFSNWGSCVDIFAPGVSMTSAWIGSDTALNTVSGTSMASPTVAGVVALYLETHPNATSAAVWDALNGFSTAGVVTGLDVASPNKLVFSSVNGAPPPPPTPTPTPAPTPTPTPNPTPTPTPVPTPTPTPRARVTVRKRLQNVSGASSSVAFPYDATNLSTTSFALTDNTAYDDPNVVVNGTQSSVTVTEEAVVGWQLTAVDCVEVAGTGGTSVPDTTVDILRHKANIVAQPGEQVTCTFTSQPLAPTAALATISGRVSTKDGFGVGSIGLVLTDAATGQVRIAVTNSFGYYSFRNLPIDHLYVVAVSETKKVSIASNSRSFMLSDDLAGLNFTATRQ
ncbi:MAG: S8 family serine peptidase [Acidobacteriota bacterium]